MRVELVFEQGSGDVNEDFFCGKANLFGVFDGATSLREARFAHGLTGGYLASSLAGDVFSANNDTLINLMDRANAVIREAMVQSGANLEDRAGLWCASVAVVRLHEDYFEWVQIGDCVIMVIHDDGSHELLTLNPNQDLETLRLWKKYAQSEDKTHLSAFQNQILKVRAEQNIAYGVLNGEKAAMSFVKSGRADLGRIKHILLFTDGLSIPRPEPGERDDFDDFVELFQEGGLGHVRDYIRGVEKTDPRRGQYPRFKVHDDIAAFSITL